MTYSETAVHVTISRARALHELRRHGVGDSYHVALFFAEMGNHATYAASAVLAWLGY